MDDSVGNNAVLILEDGSKFYGKGFGKASTVAVSYTHLRAHET